MAGTGWAFEIARYRHTNGGSDLDYALLAKFNWHAAIGIEDPSRS